MGFPARKRATYEDILNAPPHMIAEIIDGELSLLPRPSIPHALSSSVLGGDLIGPFQKGRGGPGGWWIVDEPEIHIFEDVLVPDIAGWRRERVPTLPDAAFFELAPDWICETLSPTRKARDRGSKMDRYALWGVRWAWLVDPQERSLDAYRLHEGRWLWLGSYYEDDLVRAEPFEAIEIDLLDLWGKTRQPPPLGEPD